MAAGKSFGNPERRADFPTHKFGARPLSDTAWLCSPISDRIETWKRISLSHATLPPLGSCRGSCSRAPVAQLDRALVSGTRGRAFKSPQARHLFNKLAVSYYFTVEQICSFLPAAARKKA